MNTQNGEIWCQQQLAEEALHQAQEKIDLEMAENTKKLGCQTCAGVLHSARYKRKPRGGPKGDTRFSFCCATDGCRRRHTPPSVRFLGRRVYAGVVVVLVSALSHGLSEERVRRLREALGVDRRTLQRWRQWWLDTFVRSRFWKEARARFCPPLDEETLPWSLCQHYGVERRDRLLELLQLLSPLSLSTPIQVM